MKENSMGRWHWLYRGRPDRAAELWLDIGCSSRALSNRRFIAKALSGRWVSPANLET
jgi:hypothetical protein